MILNQPPAGDTDWTTEINQNWTDIENALTSGNGLTTIASTPTQITADQNDYAFTGGSSAYIFQRLSSDAVRSITGITGGADGERYLLANVGSYDIVLKHQSASSSAANRMILSCGTDLRLEPGSAIELVYDDTTDKWRDTQRALARADFPRDGCSGIYLFEDFHRGGIVSSIKYGADVFWSAATSGLGATIAVDTTNVDATHTGISRFSTGTTSTGRSAIGKSSDNGGFAFGGGVWECEALINIATLADATNDYQIWVGFGDTTDGTNFVDGAYFLYDRDTSANWIRCAASNSTRTQTATSTVVATGWTKLRIVVNADATSVEYFVNDVSVGTVTTNIPTGNARQFTIVLKIVKEAGTTARTFDVDYVSCRARFTTSR